MSNSKKNIVLPIIGIVLAIIVSAVATLFLTVGIAQFVDDFEIDRAIWYVVCSSIALVLMIGIVILCAKALRIDKLPLIGLSFSLPFLLAGIGLLAFGIVFASFEYDFGIVAIVVSGILLIASIAVLIVSVQKLKKKTQGNKAPAVWLVSSIIMLAFSSTAIGFIHFLLLGSWLETLLVVICSLLIAAAIVGIVLSAIKIKKQSHS